MHTHTDTLTHTQTHTHTHFQTVSRLGVFRMKDVNKEYFTPLHPSIPPSLYPSIPLSLYLSIPPSLHPSISIPPSLYLSISLSLHPSIPLSPHLFTPPPLPLSLSPPLPGGGFRFPLKSQSRFGRFSCLPFLSLWPRPLHVATPPPRGTSWFQVSGSRCQRLGLLSTPSPAPEERNSPGTVSGIRLRDRSPEPISSRVTRDKVPPPPHGFNVTPCGRLYLTR